MINVNSWTWFLRAFPRCSGAAAGTVGSGFADNLDMPSFLLLAVSPFLATTQNFLQVFVISG